MLFFSCTIFKMLFASSIWVFRLTGILIAHKISRKTTCCHVLIICVSSRNQASKQRLSRMVTITSSMVQRCGSLMASKPIGSVCWRTHRKGPPTKTSRLSVCPWIHQVRYEYIDNNVVGGILWFSNIIFFIKHLGSCTDTHWISRIIHDCCIGPWPQVKMFNHHWSI